MLSFANSYHGSFGTAKLSSGLLTTPDEAVGRTAFITPPRTNNEVNASIEHVRSALTTGDYAVVIVETVQCDGGVYPSPDGFMKQLEHACREYDTLLLVDEVKTGLGRSGSVLTFERDGITPDLITFGKALGNGLPISAVVGRADVLDSETASCILTTAGNPVSTAAGLAVLETIQNEAILENVRLRSSQFQTALPEAARALSATAVDSITEIRGRGLNIGVELNDQSAPQDADAAHQFAKRVVLRLWQLGMLIYYVGDCVLEITPPLIITEKEMAEGICLIAQAIDDVANGWNDPELVEAYRGW